MRYTHKQTIVPSMSGTLLPKILNGRGSVLTNELLTLSFATACASSFSREAEFRQLIYDIFNLLNKKIGFAVMGIINIGYLQKLS